MYAEAQISFTVNPYPAEGCAPVSVSFSDQTSPAIQTWLWNFGDGNTSTVQNPVHNYVTAGDFNVSLNVKTTDGCKADLTLPNFVKVFDDPIAAFVTNGLQFSLSNPLVIFNSSASSPSVNSWHWDFGDPNLADDSSSFQNPTYIYQNQGVFPVWLFVKTIHGCSDSTSLLITVVKDSLVFPNIITPNGDNVNDFLDIPNLENYSSNRLIIYNRWGKKIYDRINYIPKVDRWDGNGLADGTYFYVLTYKGILKEGSYNGSLTIMR
jgi:gliding motility-associated-like protein